MEQPGDEEGVTFNFVDSAISQPTSCPRRNLELSQKVQAWMDSLWGYSTSVGVKGTRPAVLEQAGAVLSDFQHYLENTTPKIDNLYARAHQKCNGFTKFRDSEIQPHEIRYHLRTLTRFVLEAHLIRLTISARRQPVVQIERNVKSAQGYSGPNASWGGFATPGMEVVRAVYEKQLEPAFRNVFLFLDETMAKLDTIRCICRDAIEDTEVLWKE